MNSFVHPWQEHLSCFDCKCFCTLVVRCMAVISIVAIIIFWQVHDLSVSVVRLGGRVFRFRKWIPVKRLWYWSNA